MSRRTKYGIASVVFVLGCIFISGSLQTFPQGSGSGITPTVGVSASPVTVNLADIEEPEGDVHEVRPAKHPKGDAELEREKQEGKALAGQVGSVSGPLTVSPGAGFDGISSAESFCNCLPPDGAISAGPNHVIGTVNTSFKIFGKAGGLLVGPKSLQSLFSANPNSLSNVSDPFTAYDSVSNRFILGALTYSSSNSSSMTIAVTQTGDPTATWFVYSFAVTPSGNLLDFPHVSIGSDAIYLTGNQFQNGVSFTGARIYAYTKAQMYSGATASSVFVNVGNTATNILADSLYPAQSVGVFSTAYFLGADNCNCSTITLWKWSNAFGPSSSFTRQGGVGVTAYTQPPDAPQSGGGLLPTNDTRVSGAFWYQNTIYGAHAIGTNPGGGTVAGVQWFQVSNLDGAPSLTQQGVVAGNGQYRFYPNLAVDSLGNLGVAYAYSSTADFAGIRASGRLANGTTQPEVVLKAGQATVTNNSRYGDFSGTALDPDGSTFWHLEEYAKSGSAWGTWVASFSISGNTPDFGISAAPASQTIAAGTSASYTVTITSLDGFSSAVGLSLTGLPAGTATFTPASVTPTSGGSATSTLTITAAPAGSYNLTITGTSGSISHNAVVSLAVVNSDFSISATPSSRSIAPGGSTTYTVTVTSVGTFNSAVGLTISGQGGNTATFNPVSVTPAAGGSSGSTLTISNAVTGNYTLTITGTSGALAHSVNVTLSVTAADFSIAASPISRSVARGKTARYTVTLTSIGGFNSQVSLTTSGLPAGSSASFNPNPLTPTSAGNNSSLRISTSGSTPVGTYTVTITGTRTGALAPTHSVNVTLAVH